MPEPKENKKPDGWRSRSFKGSTQSERESSKQHALGKPGRNSGRGKFELYDASIGSRNAPVHIEYDLKQTDAASYIVRRNDIEAGRAICASHGKSFALQIQFLQNKHITQDLMVIPTELFEDLVRMAREKTI